MPKPAALEETGFWDVDVNRLLAEMRETISRNPHINRIVLDRVEYEAFVREWRKPFVLFNGAAPYGAQCGEIKWKREGSPAFMDRPVLLRTPPNGFDVSFLDLKRGGKN